MRREEEKEVGRKGGKRGRRGGGEECNEGIVEIDGENGKDKHREK